MSKHYPIAYHDQVMFSFRKHVGNAERNEELRFAENIRVIEKLLCSYPEVRSQVGDRGVSHRLAYRYYRLAKGRWRRNEREQARKVIRMVLQLRPHAWKYRIYQWQWEMRTLGTK